MDRIILDTLNKAGIEEYRIEETLTESTEAFFVRRRLDITRKNDNVVTNICVFRNFEHNGEKMKGSANILYFPGMPEDELLAKIKDAYEAAGFVKNRYYELSAPVKAVEIKAYPSSQDAIKTMVNALFEADCDKEAFVNSAEFFVTRSSERVITSKGTDVSFNRFRIKGEFVAQCKEPADVETYMDFAYADLEPAALTKLVRETLETTKARARATEAPKAGTYRVIISGRYLETILNFYKTRTSSGFIYPKYSDYKVGDNIQGDSPKGDKVNITLKALDPFSSQGIPMRDIRLTDNGKLLAIHGDERFSYYLGIEPTGRYGSIEVEKGSVSFEDMKKTPYLNVVNFSDFQVDEFNGSFGGEIRLAFLFDGEKTVPVTGGSVNGDLFEAQACMSFSSDTQKLLGYEGPYAVCFENVNVAGK